MAADWNGAGRENIACWRLSPLAIAIDESGSRKTVLRCLLTACLPLSPAVSSPTVQWRRWRCMNRNSLSVLLSGRSRNDGCEDVCGLFNARQQRSAWRRAILLVLPSLYRVCWRTARTRVRARNSRAAATLPRTACALCAAALAYSCAVALYCRVTSALPSPPSLNVYERYTRGRDGRGCSDDV